MCACLYATICVGRKINICLYKHRISLGWNRNLPGFAPRMVYWVDGEQVDCIFICTFKILYCIQVVLTKRFLNINKLKRRDPQGGGIWLIAPTGAPWQPGPCVLVCSAPCCCMWACTAQSGCGGWGVGSVTRQGSPWGNTGVSLKKEKIIVYYIGVGGD